LDIGSKIREFREAQNISRYKLAKQARIPQSTLSAIENEGKQPTIPTLEAICRGLGISLQEFFQDTSLTGDELFSAHLGSQILTLPKSKRKVIEDLLEAFKLDEENVLEPSEVAREVLNKTVRKQEPSLDAVAQGLKQGRENKGLSISQLSKETQIPQDKLTWFEEGFEVPSMKEFNAILNSLDISPFDFFRPERANAISLDIEPASAEIHEKFKQAIINGESFSFTLKCEIVDILKDGESVLPLEMQDPERSGTTQVVPDICEEALVFAVKKLEKLLLREWEKVEISPRPDQAHRALIERFSKESEKLITLIVWYQESLSGEDETINRLRQELEKLLADFEIPLRESTIASTTENSGIKGSVKYVSPQDTEVQPTRPVRRLKRDHPPSKPEEIERIAEELRPTGPTRYLRPFKPTPPEDLEKLVEEAKSKEPVRRLRIDRSKHDVSDQKIEEPTVTKQQETSRNVETLAAHRSDDPMTALPDEAWENVQELLELHKREVEKERKDRKK